MSNTDPAKADNSVVEPSVDPVVEPVEDNPEPDRLNALEQKIAELEARDTDKSRLLTASKDEALRLKAENETLKATPQDESSLSEQELFDNYLKKSQLFNSQIDSVHKTTYEQKRDELKDKFLEKHPEYKPENDTGDKNWNALLEEINDYKIPKNPSDWGKLLRKAHKNINDNSLEKGKALGMAQANLNEQAKLGGGSSGGSSPKTKRTPEQQAVRDQFKTLRPEIDD